MMAISETLDQVNTGMSLNVISLSGARWVLTTPGLANPITASVHRLRLCIKEVNKKPKPLVQRVAQSVTPAGTGAGCALWGCSGPGCLQPWLGWSCARGLLRKCSTCKGWDREHRALQCLGVARHLRASPADGMQRCFWVLLC